MLTSWINSINNLKRTSRLIISLAIAMIIFVSGEIAAISYAVSFMLTWIGFSASLLTLSWITLITSHPREVMTSAKNQDEKKTFIFLFIISSALISLFAIIFLLQHIPNYSKNGLRLHILLSAASVILSWTLVHTLFTLRYAHIFYEAVNPDNKLEQIRGRGLKFPNETEPDYLDFAYFSFVIGMTFQVSDVTITSRHIRRLCLLHAALSFVYNTVIVALAINIIAGVIQTR